MPTLADNKRDFLVNQGITLGDLARMEKTYYQGLSGLATPEAFALQDHKRAYFKTYLGLTDAQAGALSISDLERLYLAPVEPKQLDYAWNDYYTIENALKAPGGLAMRYDMRFPGGVGAALPATDAEVVTWADLSGNSRSVTNGTATTRPLYKPATFGTKPSALWDGTNDVLEYVSASFLAGVSTGFSSYVVVKPTNFSSAMSALTMVNDASNIIQRIEIALTTGAVSLSSRRVAADAVHTYSPGGTLTGGNPYVLSAINNYTARTVTLGINGTVNSTTPTWVAGTSDAIGRISVGSSSQFWRGNIAAVLVYTGAHDTTTRQSIERALGSLFGITVA